MALVELEYYSDILSRILHLEVILPGHDGWEDAEKPYRTLYFLTDYASSAKETVSLLSMRLQSMRKGIAVVLADGDIISCEKQPDCHEDCTGGVEEEIVTITREIFPLSQKREDTWLGGAGTGASGAICNGIKNGSVFSKLVLFSPVSGLQITHSMSNIVNIPDVFCCYGSEDAVKSQIKDLEDFLKKSENKAHFICEEKKDHFILWENHLEEAFQFLRE